MANVVAYVLGGDPVRLSARTVGDVRHSFDGFDSGVKYAAEVNGVSADDSTVLEDNDAVVFSPQVKGGADIVAYVLGGDPVRMEASTVGEVRDLFDGFDSSVKYAAEVNGVSATDDTTLEDNDAVVFSPQVKGGNR